MKLNKTSDFFIISRRICIFKSVLYLAELSPDNVCCCQFAKCEGQSDALYLKV